MAAREREPGGIHVGSAVRKILVVDDHPIVREGISMLLAGHGDLEVCGSAVDIPSARAAVSTLAPDIALVDLSLGHESGLDLISALADDVRSLPVLVLSMHDEALFAKRVLQAGGRGYIMKHEGTEQLLCAIRTVLAGEIYVSPAVNATLLRSITPTGRAPVAASATSNLSELTNRELQIYRLLGHGIPTREIASRLFLSAKTVESHRARIKQKLGVESSTALVAHAAEWHFRSSSVSTERFAAVQPADRDKVGS